MTRCSRPIKLAIVGASVRAAAHSAVRAGFDVVAADLFADRDLSAVCPTTRVSEYPDELPRWLAEVEADAWMYTGALENRPDLLRQMEKLKPLWGCSADAVERARDLSCLHAVLSKAGLNFPETRSTPDGLPLDGSWLCKLPHSSSGSGVRALDSAEARERAITAGALFQKRFTRGESAAVIFALNASEALTLGVSRQLVGCAETGAGPYQYCGSLCPLQVSDAVQQDLTKLGALLAGPLGLRGLVGVDVWIESGKLSVLEVNPRYTASVEVVERATGFNALTPHASAFGGNVPPPGSLASPDFAPCGKLILFAKQPVTISDEFSDWVFGQAMRSRWPLVADVPAAGQQISAGEPVLSLLAAGDSPDFETLFAARVAEVEERLYALPFRIPSSPVERLHFENRYH